MRRERFKTLYDCCYRERFPKDEACLTLLNGLEQNAADRGMSYFDLGNPTSLHIAIATRHRLSRELVDLSRFVVPLLERASVSLFIFVLLRILLSFSAERQRPSETVYRRICDHLARYYYSESEM